jgi:hypothetical protein
MQVYSGLPRFGKTDDVRPVTAADLARSATPGSEPPAQLDAITRTLWFAKAGRWEEAHDLCQDLPDPAGAWIHAWLHREEGDLGNAAYWYARAHQPVPPKDLSLADEWRQIAGALLD